MRRERALKVVLVLVGLLFTAGVYPLISSLLHRADSDTGHYDAQPLFHARRFPAHRGAESIRASQRDRLRSMVKLRPCRGDVDTRTRNSESKSRIFVRIGSARCHRGSVDRAQPGKAVSRAGIGSRSVRKRADQIRMRPI
jgi:hypothetical protein